MKNQFKLFVIIIFFTICNLINCFALSSPPSSWNYLDNTGNSANLGILSTSTITIGSRSVQNGDAIGVFYQRSGQTICGGYLIWDGSTYGFVVWGDNDQTTLKDGFAAGEAYTFKVWDAQAGVEYPATVTYYSGNQTYQSYGLTILSGINGSSLAPTLILPNNNDSNVSINPVFKWNKFTGATSYRIQVSASNSFNSFISNIIVTDTSTSLSNLWNGTTFYWRVCAKNGNDSSSWSNVWSFTTAINTTNFNKLSFQGILSDNNGQIVSDGSYTLTFKIYTITSGGTSLWNETQNVYINNGLFYILLGSQNPLTLPFNTSYWIGISIGNNSELSPRSPLTGNVYNTGFGR